MERRFFVLKNKSYERMSKLIKIKNLKKTYKKENIYVKAIDDVSLDIERGDIYGIIGLSGAGKSSLVRCINMLERPDSGEVIVGKFNMGNLSKKELRDVRKKIGMIFQGFNLLNSKTVFENIAFPLRIMKISENEIKEKVSKLLKLVDLTDKAHAYPSNLSGGQKQRVGIARALANDPEVLLCDEATSALDPKTTKQILALLKDINKNLGLTIVVITHEMDVIKEICNKVTILESGKIIDSGNTIDLFSSPSQEKTRHFVDNDKYYPVSSGSGYTLRLGFTKGSAGEPIISQIIKRFGVDVNIIWGSIEYIQEIPIGKLLINCDAQANIIDEIIDFLEKSNVRVEVIQNARNTRVS